MILWKLGRASFDYGSLRKEIAPILGAAAFDALLIMMPVVVMGLPAGYVVIAALPATIVIGWIYQRTHGDWPALRPYLFALLSRMLLIIEILLFMYSVAGVPR